MGSEGLFSVRMEDPRCGTFHSSANLPRQLEDGGRLESVIRAVTVWGVGKDGREMAAFGSGMDCGGK